MTKRSWKRSALRIARSIGVIYLLVVVILAIGQRRLIYFPTRLNPKVAQQMAAREGFKPWRNRSDQIIGWYLPATSAPQGAVLIIHGNAGCALDRDYLAKPIHEAAPVDVYVLEYPGYGTREGSPSQESVLTAAEEAFVLLPSAQPRFIVSESLGAGPVAHLAGLHADQVSGIAMFAPYSDLVSVAQRKMWLLPVRLILRDRYDPAQWLKGYHGRVFVALAEKDEVIPIEFGRRLYESYEGPKQVQVIPGAHHNEIGEQSPEWWRNVFLFWEQGGTNQSQVLPH